MLFELKVALVDVLRSLHIKPNGIVGHSVGELGCAYADGCLTADETVLAAYWRGRCVMEGNLPPGRMAAVGLSKSTCYLPPSLSVFCLPVDFTTF